jgi:hypothetical protein
LTSITSKSASWKCSNTFKREKNEISELLELMFSYLKIKNSKATEISSKTVICQAQEILRRVATDQIKILSVYTTSWKTKWVNYLAMAVSTESNKSGTWLTQN